LLGRTHLLLDFQDGRVHVPDVIEVGEDKGGVDIEAARDDVFGVFVPEPVAVLKLQLRLEEEFLVVRQLDHQRHVEGLLEPFGEPGEGRVCE